MEQTYIYEYLGIEEDPVFNKIVTLKKGKEMVVISNLSILFNQYGLYEVITPDEHECFKDLNQCYEKVCDLVNEDVRGLDN